MDYPQILLRKINSRSFGRKIKIPELPLISRFLRDYIMLYWRKYAIPYWHQLTAIGVVDEMEDYEKIKLGIFNQLNFFQLVTGVLAPFVFFLTTKHFPVKVLFIAMLPAVISGVSLVLNYFKKHD